MKQFIEILGITSLLILGAIAVFSDETEFIGPSQSMKTLSVANDAIFDASVGIAGTALNASNAAFTAKTAIINGTVSMQTSNTANALSVRGGAAFAVANFQGMTLNSAANVTVSNASNLSCSLVIWGPQHANAGKGGVIAANGTLLLYGNNTKIITISSASPEMTVAGGINATFYDISPSHREVDGVVWKRDIEDAVTGRVFADGEALPVPQVATIYRYTLTKEAQMKTANDFEGDDAQERVDAYNASLRDSPGRIGFIVEGINPKFLRTTSTGESIDLTSILLEKIAALEKRVAALEGR